MQCPACSALNDPDARFCAACGSVLAENLKAAPARAPRAYLFALLLVPVIAAAVGVGYYKFVLPRGIAAVVNGEEITRSELDAAVARAGAAGEAPALRRLRVLNRLIAERIMEQEARKAGVAVSKEELAAAAAEARASAGLDESSFRKEMASRYGSAENFEKALERRLLIGKFLAVKFGAAGRDPGSVDRAVRRWFEAVSDKANVRMALSEQGPGPGCNGCSGGAPGPNPGLPGCAAMGGGPKTGGR